MSTENHEFVEIASNDGTSWFVDPVCLPPRPIEVSDNEETTSTLVAATETTAHDECTKDTADGDGNESDWTWSDDVASSDLADELAERMPPPPGGAPPAPGPNLTRLACYNLLFLSLHISSIIIVSKYLRSDRPATPHTFNPWKPIAATTVGFTTGIPMVPGVVDNLIMGIAYGAGAYLFEMKKVALLHGTRQEFEAPTGRLDAFRQSCARTFDFFVFS